MYEHGKTHLQPVSLFKDSSPAERFDGRMEGSEMRCNGKTNAENPGKRSSWLAPSVEGKELSVDQKGAW